MKKNSLQIPLLILALLVTFSISMEAQGNKKSKKKPDPTEDYFNESGFKHKLWYGGGFNLGFSGSSQLSLFSIGVSPMVGYKIIDKVSVGPRLSVQYNQIKGIATDGVIRKAQPVSYSVGVFSRWKFLPFLFAHAEYERENSAGVFLDGNGYLVYDISDGKVQTYREARDNVYLGLGYTSNAGALGYEILLLYNANTPENSLELPFSVRFGLSYNF
ncbi:MAG: hypothetical protein KDC34_20310 [Saprospiraceae bacterium]|nr:hypothetical protein [Saprospiraceae bacterium]